MHILKDLKGTCGFLPLRAAEHCLLHAHAESLTESVEFCRNCHVFRANDHAFQTSAFELEIVQKDEHIELLKSSLEKNNENLQVLTNKLKDTVSAAHTVVNLSLYEFQRDKSIL